MCLGYPQVQPSPASFVRIPTIRSRIALKRDSMNTISMTTKKSTGLADIMAAKEEVILAEWMREMKDSVRRSDLIKDSDLRSECASFLQLVK